MPLKTRRRFHLSLGVGLLLVAFAGCKGPASVADLPPYPEQFQRAWFGAMSDLAKGDLEAAHAGFMECLGLEPDEPSVPFQLGKIELEQGKPGDALAHFNAALEGQPGDLWIREYRGRAALETGDVGTALKDAELIVKARAGDLERAFGWIDRFLQFRETAGALQLCDAYESVSGPDVDVAMQRLMILDWLGDEAGFEDALQAALNAHPDEPEFQLEQAALLQESGDIQGALLILERLHAEEPDDGYVALELARLLTAAADMAPETADDRTDQAIELLRIAIGSGDVPVEEKMDILVGYLMLAGMTDEWHAVTAELIELAQEAHPDEVKFAQMQADLAYERGDLLGTYDALERALAIDPGDREVWRDAVAVCAELEHWAQMAAWGAQAIERFPLDAELHLLAAMGASQTQDLPTALTLLKRGAPLAASTPLLKARFKATEGDVLHDLGRDEEAAVAYEASLALHPDDPFVLNNHAYYLALRGAELERALACAERANALMPGTPSFLDTEAWVLHMLGRNEDALDAIESAMIAGASNDPEVLEHKADILRALGRDVEAVEAYEQAIEAGADADRIITKMDGLP